MAEEKKKPDGRRNNGAVKGVSRGQGRPRKIADKDITRLTLSALKKVFGSEEKMCVEVAKMAKDGSAKHWDYLMNYRYGKPKEMQQIDIKTKIDIPIIDFAKPKTIDITPQNERIEANRNAEEDRETRNDSSPLSGEN